MRDDDDGDRRLRTRVCRGMRPRCGGGDLPVVRAVGMW